RQNALRAMLASEAAGRNPFPPRTKGWRAFAHIPRSRGPRALRYWRLMQAILAVTLPFFALVLCGYLAASRGVLAESAIPGLNGFVLFFALPCMLFRFGMNTPVLELLNPAMLGLYVAVALMIVGLTVAVTRSPRVNMKNAAFGALVAAFPNTG